MASNSLEGFITKFSAELMAFAPKLLSFATGFSSTILLFVISIIIAGILLPQAEASEKAAHSIFNTLIGEKSKGFVHLSVLIIRSVVQGVLGVAFIQSLMGGIGIWAIGIPAAGLWALIILFIAILQLPPLIVLGPLVVYVFSYADTTPAILFLVWSIIVSSSDAFLKPLLLGRGVDVPMLAILLGAIGGMMMSGIIGLFVGAVVLALSYKIFQALLVDDILDKESDDGVIDTKNENI
jgi:predicted PurR-regulated permease PerM